MGSPWGISCDDSDVPGPVLTRRSTLRWVSGAALAVVFVLASVTPGAAFASTSDRDSASTITGQRAPDLGGGSVVRHGLWNSNSLDWAGYAATGPAITSVAGSWTQPAATCPGNKVEQSAFWVGIDGFTTDSPTVEQIGTDADCTKGTHKNPGGPIYYAWFEMYPLPIVVLDPVLYPVTPGNVLTASVTVTGAGYVLAIADAGRWTFSTTQVPTRATLNSSAEWITEAPLNCKNGKCKPIALANFSVAAFTGATVNSMAVNGPGLTVNQITMTKNKKGTIVKASTSALDPTGHGFTVHWLAI